MSQIDINAKVLKYAQVSGRALQLAGSIIEKQTAKTASVAASAQDIAKALVGAGLIEADMQKMANDQLGQHELALEILGNVVNEYKTVLRSNKEASVGRLGEGVKPSAPAAPRTELQNPNYMGRRTSEKTAADHAYLAKMIPGYSY